MLKKQAGGWYCGNSRCRCSMRRGYSHFYPPLHQHRLSQQRRRIWNAAIDACINIISPTPHVEEERECTAIAKQLDALRYFIPSPRLIELD